MWIKKLLYFYIISLFYKYFDNYISVLTGFFYNPYILYFGHLKMLLRGESQASQTWRGSWNKNSDWVVLWTREGELFAPAQGYGVTAGAGYPGQPALPTLPSETYWPGSLVRIWPQLCFYSMLCGEDHKRQCCVQLITVSPYCGSAIFYCLAEARRTETSLSLAFRQSERNWAAQGCGSDFLPFCHVGLVPWNLESHSSLVPTLGGARSRKPAWAL